MAERLRIVVAVLLFVAVPLLRTGESLKGKTRHQLLVVEELLNRWHAIHSDFPENAAQLLTIIDTSIPDVARNRLLLDGWGHPMIYRHPSTHKGCDYDLYSVGPNGLDDGEGKDDIPTDDTGVVPGCRGHGP